MNISKRDIFDTMPFSRKLCKKYIIVIMNKSCSMIPLSLFKLKIISRQIKYVNLRELTLTLPILN